jgi:putative DNA primase/helicase
MIANGHEAHVIAQGQTEEEMEKRLGAMLLNEDSMISFDNREHNLVGST